MGAADSKISFKRHVFQLFETKNIPINDPYWCQFWQVPESATDIFTLFSASDIRRTRINSLENLQSLLISVIYKLLLLKEHNYFLQNDYILEKETLNCVRILTRVMPFIFEANNLNDWQSTFFWSKDSEFFNLNQDLLSNFSKNKNNYNNNITKFKDKYLGAILIDFLIDLLFLPNFTIPSINKDSPNPTFLIWETGIGCTNPIGIKSKYDMNRAEVLRLLVTLMSQAMYLKPITISNHGVQFTSYLVTNPNKKIVLTLLCSLLNIILKYSPGWRISYDVFYVDPRKLLVTYSIQVLLVLLQYPIPNSMQPFALSDNLEINTHNYDSNNNDNKPINWYQYYFSRLHRPQDFQFIADGIIRSLNQPLEAHISYLPAGSRECHWINELIALLWISTQKNEKFLYYCCKTKKCLDFLVLFSYFISENIKNPAKEGQVRLCVYTLQTISAEKSFCISANKNFDLHNSLPSFVRMPNFTGSYIDYLIVSICNLFMNYPEYIIKLIAPLLQIIYNLSPYIQDLSYSSSAALFDLFDVLCAKEFLFAGPENHILLELVLQSLVLIVELQFSSNLYVVFFLLKRLEALKGLQSLSIKDANDLYKSRSHGNFSNNISSKKKTNKNKNNNQTFSNDDFQNSKLSFKALEKQPEEANNGRKKMNEERENEELEKNITEIENENQTNNDSNNNTISSSNDTTAGSRSARSNGEWYPTEEWLDGWKKGLPLESLIELLSQVKTKFTSVHEYFPDLDHLYSNKMANSHLENIIHDPPVKGSSYSKYAPLEIQQFIDKIGCLDIIKTSDYYQSFIPYKFEWTADSVAWYESLQWGFIFRNEMKMADGTIGLWNGTNIKLFRVQEIQPETPSLLRPKGAIDAVAQNVIERISNLANPMLEPPNH